MFVRQDVHGFDDSLAGVILYVVMWKIERDHGYTGCHKDSAL